MPRNPGTTSNCSRRLARRYVRGRIRGSHISSGGRAKEAVVPLVPFYHSTFVGVPCDVALCRVVVAYLELLRNIYGHSNVINRNIWRE